MQIHEITQKRPVNEGVLSALANKAVTAATGVSQDIFEPQTGANARMGAFKANQQVVTALSKQMQLAWAQTVQEFMSRNKDATGAPVTKLTDLTPASFNTLEPQLITMINNAAKIKDYKTIGQGTEDPTVKGAAQAAVEAIDKGVDAIMAASMDPKINAQGLQAIWQSLVRDGIAPAQQIAQFDPQGSGSETQSAAQKGQAKLTQDAKGNWLVNGQPANPKDPVHAQALSSLNQQMGGKP